MLRYHLSMSGVKGMLIIAVVLSVQIWWIYRFSTHTFRLKTDATPELWGGDMVHKFEHGFTDQLNPEFADFISQRWLVGPSEKPLALRNMAAVHNSQMGQGEFVDKLLDEKTGGFYVECGAANGETFSNTLFFERFRAWEGLLVEANPNYFKEILETHRKAYSINVCLSPSNASQKVEFAESGMLGGLESYMDETHLKGLNRRKIVSRVQCFTLGAILNALGRLHVDYFSLDVEGAELEILATIPWSVVQIDVISVEYRSSDGRSIDEPKTAKKLGKVRELFRQIGLYEEVGILPWGSGENVEKKESRGLDVFYKRKR